MFKSRLTELRSFLLDVFFPKFCVNCGKEGEYLCLDCFSLIDIVDIQYCPFCFPAIAVADGKTCQRCKNKGRKLTGLYCAASYEDLLAQKMIRLLKYAPFVREISENLALVIYSHFLKLEKRPDYFNKNNFVLTPVPLHKKRLKARGYNQAEEIAKHLSGILEIPLVSNCLVKTKQTVSQTELTREQRENNVANAFQCINPEPIRGKNILLLDDISTTGSTIEECCKILREAKDARVKEIWGVVVARGQ